MRRSTSPRLMTRLQGFRAGTTKSYVIDSRPAVASALMTLLLSHITLQELPGAFRLRFGKEVGWGGSLDNPTAIDQNDLVCGFAGKSHLVCHHKHGAATLRELLHDRHNLPNQFRIERRGGFIEEQQFRLHGKRPSNADPL